MIRRLGALGVAALAVATLAVATPAPGGGPPAAAADAISLALTAQPFVLAPDAPWTATFAVAGDLATVGVPPAGPSAPSTTAPAAPPSSPPPSTAPPEPPAELAPPSSAAPAPPTSVAAAPAGPAVEARALVHRRIDDRAAMQADLEGDVGPVVSRLTVPVTPVRAGGATSVEVTMPTAVDPDTGGALIFSRPGLYPVTVDLVVGGEVVASTRTYVERLPSTPDDDDASVHLAVVATVDDPGPAAAPAAVANARDAVAAVVGSGAALEGAMSVRLPPSIVEDLPEPELDDLRTGLRGVEVLPTPAIALDPSSAVAAGQGEAFSRQLRAGEDALGAALPTAAHRRSAWLVDDPLSAPAAAVLREPLGFDLLVFDPAVYDELDGGIGGFHDPMLHFDVDLGDGTTLPGFLTSPLSRWLDGGALARRGMTPLDGAVAIMAELLVARRELGADLRRSVVLDAPTGVAPDPEVLRALRTIVDATPNVALATLSTLPAVTDAMTLPDAGVETVRLPPTAGADLADRVNRIELTRINATGAGSMLLDQSQLADWNAQLDALLATTLDDDDVQERLAAITAEAEAVYDDVVAPRPFTLTLTGRTSTLRLNLTNTGDEDLRVVVHPTSPKLTFPDGDVAQTLAAGSVTEVVLTVEARTNGTSAIGIEVLTPVGSLVVEGPIVLTAKVNALSGLGQVVTGGALLVLLSWWYGHFRRRRRERRAMLGEVDNPPHLDEAVSPDAAEATVPAPSDSVSDP